MTHSVTTLFLFLSSTFAQDGRPLFLITAFEPFNGRSTNRSELVLNEIWKAHDSKNSYFQLAICVLPVESSRAALLLCVKEQQKQPAAVLALGEYSSTDRSTLLWFETIASNAWRPEGNYGAPRPVEAGGEKQITTNFPYQDFFSVTDKNTRKNFALSSNAGMFSCNEVFYTALRYYKGSKTPVGMAHVNISLSKVGEVSKVSSILLQGLEQIALARANNHLSQLPHFSNTLRFPMNKDEQKKFSKSVQTDLLNPSELDFYRKLMQLSY